MLRPAALAYAGTTPLDDPEVSPLYAELVGLPPTLLQVGGDEILLDDARRFVAQAREAGADASVGVYPGLWHVFPAFPGLPESRDAIAEAGAFIRRHTDP
jgi:epsilon-lactone hydrolase